MNNEQYRIGRTAAFVVFLALSAVLSWKPLADPDLGWHLAGGLWILDHRAVPRLDPFGMLQAQWVDYSWLAQVVFAAAYRAGGFTGVRILQFAVLMLFSGMLLLVFLSLNEKRFGRSGTALYAAVFSSLLAVIFAAPVFELRPQMFSLFFLVVFLGLAARRRYPALFLIAITVMWANIHVYWIFLPLLYVLFAWREHKSKAQVLIFGAVFAGAGIINPYGADLYRTLARYAFQHNEANSLIKEFQSLSLSCGLIFWICLLLAVLFLLSARAVWRREGTALLALLLFGVMGAWEIKFVPLFGLFAAYFAPQTPLFERLFRHLGGRLPAAGSGTAGSGERRTIALLLAGAALAACGAIALTPVPPLTEKYGRILQIADVLVQTPATGSMRLILNDFDDGGWLALGLYRARAGLPEAAELRTVVDGRTLVAGPEILKAVKKLVFAGPGWCEAVTAWSPAFAVLPDGLQAGKELAAGSCGKWRALSFVPGYYVLEKNES